MTGVRDPAAVVHLVDRLPVPLNWRLAAFYGAAFLIIGLYMPFWPAWLSSRGLDAAEIGILLSVGTWTKIVASPLAAHLADRTGARRHMMIGLALAAWLTMSLYIVAADFWTMVSIAMLVGATFSPLMPLGENMTMIACRSRNMDYGRIRLWGSLTFMAGASGGGMLLAGRSDDLILWLLLAAFALGAGVCLLLPDVRVPRPRPRHRHSGRLLRAPVFIVFLVAASLIQSSHAAYYGFSTIHWRAAGLTDGMIGFLWAEGVAAEVLLFAFSGAVVRRIGIGRLFVVAGVAAVARWLVMAGSHDLAVLVVVQALHALTFGATHLAAMHFLQRAVPEAVSATAQALYAAVAMGIVFAVATMAAGAAYDMRPSSAFLIMAAMAAAGLVAALALSRLWRGETLAPTAAA